MTKEEKREYSRKWYQANKEKKRKYYLEHADELREKQKQYRFEHADEIREKDKQYRLEHADELREYQKQYSLEHKDELKQYYLEHLEYFKEKNKQYRLEHADERKEYMKQYRQTKEGRASNLLQGYNYADRQRGLNISNNITAEWIVANIFNGQKCIYCGDSDWAHLGTDRIDNDKPHTAENCVCACGICNIERADRYSVEEFIEYRKLYPRILGNGIEKSWEITELPSGIKVIKKKPVE